MGTGLRPPQAERSWIVWRGRTRPRIPDLTHPPATGRGQDALETAGGTPGATTCQMHAGVANAPCTLTLVIYWLPQFSFKGDFHGTRFGNPC